MNPSGRYDAIIIGAGMSGLAAGIRLAYYDKKVCVLDQHYMPGGLNSFYSLDGRKFDVGLHAMTNYVARDVRQAPLNKLLRQLKLKYDDFALVPQRYSEVKFPGMCLRFTNNYADFESEVREKFPRQADRFTRLVGHIRTYNDLDLQARPQSARAVVGEFLSDPLLIDMLFCPLMFYGSANVDDMEFGQFCIMFKSIFCEGFCRPREGVRRIVSVLLKKYKACHGELRMGDAVKKLHVKAGSVSEVELANGERLSAAHIISSAGCVETLRLCSDNEPADFDALKLQAGKMTFIESISILDRQPASLGFNQTITFYNNSERFRYRPSEDAADTASAVVCCPNNFQFAIPLDEGVVRVTNIASFDQWAKLSPEEYGGAKKTWYERSVAEAVKFVPDFRPYVKFVDVFTPKTIYKFTQHLNGAVYGAPEKSKSGRTRLKNLFICGTDQGFLGIVGAMLSGISMANLHVLQAGSRQDSE